MKLGIVGLPNVGKSTLFNAITNAGAGAANYPFCTIEPNVAKKYTVNSDFTVYTISLREGMRWSDGVPFTADDVLFFYDKLYRKNSFGAGTSLFFSIISESIR